MSKSKNKLSLKKGSKTTNISRYHRHADSNECVPAYSSRK